MISNDGIELASEKNNNNYNPFLNYFIYDLNCLIIFSSA